MTQLKHRMPKVAALALLTLGANAYVAHAEKWRADTVVIPEKSAGTCGSIPAVYYDFDLTSDALTAWTDQGLKAFTKMLKADGSVEVEYRLPDGGRRVISGNARTRQLQVTNLISACSWALLPR